MRRATPNSSSKIVKKIFLTGASSGIGKAIAKAATEKGHEVWGTSRDISRIPSLRRLHCVQLDLSNPDSIDGAFNTALAEAGNFDVLINNAGSGHFGPAENLSEKEIASQFQILVFGHMQLMRLALRMMQARGEGLIINVTSLASRLPVPFMAAYNAAKAAMASFTMTIQLELPDQRYEAKVAKTWNKVERNMKNAPRPDLVARRVCELIDQTSPPPRMAIGDTFQTKIAPLIFRFLPQRVRIWGLKKYYGL